MGRKMMAAVGRAVVAGVFLGAVAGAFLLSSAWAQDTTVPIEEAEGKPIPVPSIGIGRMEGSMHLAAKLTQEERERLQIDYADDWVESGFPLGVLVIVDYLDARVSDRSYAVGENVRDGIEISRAVGWVINNTGGQLVIGAVEWPSAGSVRYWRTVAIPGRNVVGGAVLARNAEITPPTE